MSAGVNLDLGDLITITETVTGINTTKIIIGRQVQVQATIWTVKYILADSNDGAFFLLGTSGSAELGSTTTLGF